MAGVLLSGLAAFPATAQDAPAAQDDALYASDKVLAEQAFDAPAFARTFSHHKATVNGIQLHYVLAGKGDPVLLLHGWPESWYSWRRVMPLLAANHTVIAPDMPGFGDSQAAPSADKKTVAACLYALMRQLNLPRVSLVAHDMGGPVAYAYAAAHPEAVSKIVLSETAIPGFGFADGSPNDLLNPTPQSVSGIWHFAFFMKTDTAVMLITGHERAFACAMVKESYYNPAAFTGDEWDELTRWFTSPGGIRNGLDYYRMLFEDAKQNQEYGKTKLTMPVLVLNGEAGFLKNVAGKSVRSVAADVREGIIPKSGHFIAEERPGYLAQQLRAFLDAKP